MNGWPTQPDLSLAALAAVFLAIGLACEGLLLLWQETRSPAAQRLRRRLQAWVPELTDSTPASAPGLWKPGAAGIGEAGTHPGAGAWRALDGWLAQRLAQAGWAWRPAPFLGLCGAISALGGLGAMAAASLVPGAGAGTLGLGMATGVVCGGLPWWVLGHRRHRRLQAMTAQLPDALDLITRAMRSGLAFAPALQLVAEEAPQPIAGEFRLVHDQIQHGRDADDAFEDLAQRVPVDDVRFLVVALKVQRQTGGQLGELLDNIATLIRQRLTLGEKVRMLSAEGRLSARILALLPLATAAALYAIRPDFIRLLWTDPAGQALLKVSLGLFMVGLLWMNRITTLRA